MDHIGKYDHTCGRCQDEEEAPPTELEDGSKVCSTCLSILRNQTESSSKSVGQKSTKSFSVTTSGSGLKKKTSTFKILLDGIKESDSDDETDSDDDLSSLLKSFSGVSDCSWDHTEGFAQAVVDLSKEIQFSPITVDGKVQEVPPFGTALLAARERQNRLRSVASQYSGSGSSLFIDLFADHILVCYNNCLNGKDRRMRSHMNQSLLLGGSVGKGQDSVTRKVILGRVLGIVYGCIGVIDSNVRWLNNQDSSVRVSRTDKTDEAVQKDLCKQFEMLHSWVNLLEIDGFSVGREFLDAIELFQDLLYQEMHAFATLQGPYPDDIQSVAKQMKIRLNRFLFIVEHFSSLQQSSFSIYRKEMTEVLEETRTEWVQTCKDIKQLLDEICRSSSGKHQLVEQLYHSLHEAYECLRPATTFTFETVQKFIRVKNELALNKELEGEAAERGYLSYLGQVMDTCLKTTFSEGLLACFVYMNRENVLQQGEILESLETVEKILQIQNSQSLDEIQSRIDSFGRTIEEEDQTFFEFIKEVVPILHCGARQYEALNGTIRVHLERLRGGAVLPVDRGRAIRDISVVCRNIYNELKKFVAQYREREEFSKHGCENRDLIDFYEVMIRECEFNLQGLETVFRNIDLLLDDGFQSLLERQRLEDEASLQSLQAREQAALKAAEDLIASEAKKKAVKSSARKKAKGKKAPQGSKRKLKSKVLPEKPKGVSAPLPSFWSKMESQTSSAPVSPEFQITDLGLVEPEIATNASQRILLLKKRVLEKSVDGDSLRETWKQSTLANLELFLEQLGEYQRSTRVVSVGLIHGEIDLLRRILEMGLKCALALYPCKQGGSHVLTSLDVSLSHDINKLVHLLHSNPKVVPDNVRKVLLLGRNIWAAFSRANNCVNYPSSSSRSIVHFQARLLLDHLSKSVTHPEGIDMKQHDQLVDLGLRMIEKLMHAGVDPMYVCEVGDSEGLLVPPDVEDDPVFGSRASAGETKIQPLADVQVDLPRVSNRGQALQAIDEMLQWIQLRLLSQAQGRIDRRFRTQLRNEALEHVRIYLMRVRGKLNDHNRLSKTSVAIEEISLGRRLLKEVSVAALLHEEIYEGSEHIVRTNQLRYHNDPSVLNAILGAHSRAKGKLPDLSEDRFSWLHHAHQWTSYPIELPIYGGTNGHKKNNLERDIQRYVALNNETKTLEGIEAGFTVQAGGSNLSHEQHMQHVESFIHEIESKYLFDALRATFQTIMVMPF